MVALPHILQMSMTCESSVTLDAGETRMFRTDVLYFHSSAASVAQKLLAASHHQSSKCVLTRQ